MTSSISVHVFYERLQQSNLLTAEVLEAVRRDVGRVGPQMRPDALGRRLVSEGRLTDWHVEMMLSGKFAFFLGKYKLLDLLGYGGMGVVFKAENANLGRTVALKVLHKERMKHPAVVARFHREIQAAATLNNPHVVIAYDADCVNDTHFLVMEYVNGTNLATILEQEGKLHLEEAAEFVRQAAVGLQHAHERGMVHRDIKPSNLIVSGRHTAEPLVKVLDMGLARFVSEELDEIVPVGSVRSRDDGLTQIGQIMGTPDYMSPEQAWDTKAVDIRSDIYSLGCTLYLFLTGRFPFPGETTMEKVMARTDGDPLPPSTFEPEVPPELDAVVLKMMARQPQDRFQTPAMVARALERFAVLPDDVLTVVPAGTGVPVAFPISPDEPPIPLVFSAGRPPSTVDLVHDLTLIEESTTAPSAAHPAAPSPTEVDPRLDEFLQNLTTAATAPSQSDGIPPWDPRRSAGNKKVGTQAPRSRDGDSRPPTKRQSKQKRTPPRRR